MTENRKLYKSIGEVAKMLNLINKKNGKLSTYTLRYWEKEFKQIKPYIFAGNRRYYDEKSIDILRNIHYLLKNKGMTIKGVRNLLNNNQTELDDDNNKTINRKIIKTQLNKISNLLKKLKSNG